MESESRYTKPKEKNGRLAVEFRIGDFRQVMALPIAPSVGDYFHDPSEKEVIIKRVIYKPWNEFMADVIVEGEYAPRPADYSKLKAISG